MQAFTHGTPARTISEHDIRKVLGPLDDDLVAAIQDTGATRDEIRRAYACFDEEDTDFMLDRPMTHRMRRVYDILRDDLDRMQRYER
jgi:hypothetical protein